MTDISSAALHDTFWPNFSKGSAPVFGEVDEDVFGLAESVLTTYGIPCSNENRYGGNLYNIDIKRLDPLQVIKLSLIETTASNSNIGMLEPIVNVDGEVEFIEIGKEIAEFSDIYYEIQSAAYTETCGGVLIVGEKPMVERRMESWKPIWSNGYKEVFRTGLTDNNCVEVDFNQFATIVFNDPNMDSQYDDGIDNLYEITDPLETITGWAREIYWPGYENDSDTTVKLQSQAKIVVRMPTNSLGNLFFRPDISDEIFHEPDCYAGLLASADAVGVDIPIPPEFRYTDIRGMKVDKLANILDVYVLGLEINNLRSAPKTPEAALKDSAELNRADDLDLLVTIYDAYNKLIKLNPQEHYVIKYDNTDPNNPIPSIVFANNSDKSDPLVIDGINGNYFLIDPDCPYADVVTDLKQHGFILPTGPFTGRLVGAIYVSFLLDTPSIEVYNPDGLNDVAYTIANELVYNVAPIISRDEPAPYAFCNGGSSYLLDMTDGIADHDPTTTQNLTETAIDKAYSKMAGNGMELNLAFLNSSQSLRISQEIYDYLNMGAGIETTYILGPDEEPELGSVAPNGGVVNSITYSYQDTSSYTISVSCGQYSVGGFAQITGGPHFKTTESPATTGTILQDNGNHTYFRVRVDGIGDRVAVNMCPDVLRVGDKVQCTLHNNPMEG